MIITIDGPVGTGKSTVAKKLAHAIGFIFFDTGAMYRILTYGLLKHHIDLSQTALLEDFLKDFKVDFKIIKHEKHYFFEGEDISEKIRGKEVTAAVSAIASIKSVRDKLTALQRTFAIGVNAVFEGRDMATVVFPDADLKIFLTGRNEVRAQRRYNELKTKYLAENQTLTFEQCLDEINERDRSDSTRQYAPLVQASDAFVIDTSDKTIEEVINSILEHKETIRTKSAHRSTETHA